MKKRTIYVKPEDEELFAAAGATGNLSATIAEALRRTRMGWDGHDFDLKERMRLVERRVTELEVLAGLRR